MIMITNDEIMAISGGESNCFCYPSKDCSTSAVGTDVQGPENCYNNCCYTIVNNVPILNEGKSYKFGNSSCINCDGTQVTLAKSNSEGYFKYIAECECKS